MKDYAAFRVLAFFLLLASHQVGNAADPPRRDIVLPPLVLSGAAQLDESHPTAEHLIRYIAHAGSVPITLRLDVDWSPEGDLDVPGDIELQRALIAAAQAEVSGTLASRIAPERFQITHQSRYVPLMSLEVDLPTLRVLGSMDGIREIHFDNSGHPQLDTSAGQVRATGAGEPARPGAAK